MLVSRGARGEKVTVGGAELVSKVHEMLEQLHQQLFDR